MGDLKGWMSLVAAVMVIALFLRLISSGGSNTYDDVTRGLFLVSLATLVAFGLFASIRHLRR